MGGYSAVLSSSSDSVFIAVLTNTSGSGATVLGQQLGSVIRGTPPPPFERASPLPRPVRKPLAPTERRRYVGRYAMRDVQDDGSAGTRSVTLEVIEVNGRLTAQLTGDPVEELVPLDRENFVALMRPDLKFRFNISQGRATRVSHEGPYGRYAGPRLAE
jgi:hypothetical protein